MATSFPTGIDSFTNPSSSSPLNSPSHSQQHSNANDAIAALEAKVGVNGSAVTTSLDYLVKNTASTDPGHKHTLSSVTGFPSFVDKETPSGSIDGSNATFTLAHSPTSGSLHLFLNGGLQNEGSGNDYSLSGTTITFATPPESGSVLLATYRY